MPTVTSADGTAINYLKQGSGPALVLIDGALCHTEAGIISMPGFVIVIKNLVMRKNMKLARAIAHTLPHDVSIMDMTKFAPPAAAAK